MSLGEDYELSSEEKAARDTEEAQQVVESSMRLIVRSNGTHGQTTIITSDGVDLTKYGLVAAAWVVDPDGPAQLSLVFLNSDVELETMFGNTDVSVRTTEPTVVDENTDREMYR